jgi:magnesium transporter
MSDTRYTTIRSDATRSRVQTLNEALSAMKGSDTVWLDYFNPTREQLEALIEPLHLHPLSVEDCLDQDQIPKIDLLPDYTFVLFNVFRLNANGLSIEEVDLFLGRNFLITVHRSEQQSRVLGPKLDELIELNLSDACRGADFLMHVVLDYLVDEKLRAIEALQDGLEASQERILNDTAAFNPAELMQMRRDLLSMRKSLLHEREVLARICRKDSPFVSEKSIFSFRDIHDHLCRFFEVTEICREMISSDMEIYLSIINNRMTMVANRTNRVMRRLTLITTVFMPLTLLAGIGGMSEFSMMTGSDNWKLSYPLFCLGMTVIGLVNYYALRWLDRWDERRYGTTDETLRSSLGGPTTRPLPPG